MFEYFLREQRAGRTPNPDVLCNREIKFGVALNYVRRLGASRFATGHYARLVQGADGGVELHKALDAAKDQSYFLHAVAKEHLAETLMPLGELEKGAVRERARKAGLPVFDKPDSTGICFIGERPFREFLGRFLEQTPGHIESPEGERLGTHQGWRSIRSASVAACRSEDAVGTRSSRGTWLRRTVHETYSWWCRDTITLFLRAQR